MEASEKDIPLMVRISGKSCNDLVAAQTTRNPPGIWGTEKHSPAEAAALWSTRQKSFIQIHLSNPLLLNAFTCLPPQVRKVNPSASALPKMCGVSQDQLQQSSDIIHLNQLRKDFSWAGLTVNKPQGSSRLWALNARIISNKIRLGKKSTSSFPERQQMNGLCTHARRVPFTLTALRMKVKD